MFRVGYLIAAALLATSACSSSDDSTGPICNMLANDGPTVTVMASPATAPTPAGGTVAEGTYVLTAATVFGAPAIPPTTLRAAFQIIGSTMEQVGTFDGSEMRYTSTFTTSGSSLTTTDTCPTPKSSTHPFTATATTLRIFEASSVGTIELIHTKR